MGLSADAKKINDPEEMAARYLAAFFQNQKIEYPINPFQMLKDEGILFSLSDFQKLEGVYIPAASEDDIPTVGINANRPITRQRFTAAHEMCHHFRDANSQISCPIGDNKSEIELFANKFAAALLMPMTELRGQVNKRKNTRGNVSFDDVLEISAYFGVSFESCLYRIAYRIHAIEGDTEPASLKKRIQKYKPDKRRKDLHISYYGLYEGLIDSYQEQLAFSPSPLAKALFQNEYIYNDSRMEGLNVSIEEASEIVTDLRMNSQHSEYCKEEHEAYMSIAGHYAMYQDIFAEPVKETINVYEAISLHKKLFSYYPYPEFGGTLRQNNTLVLGAKFDTVDYTEIFNELAKVDAELKEFFEKRDEIKTSEYIKSIARVHHRITQIHPFPEGNGRTSRAFMNVAFVRASLPPIYIRVEDKKDYIDALSRADIEGVYDDLYEVIMIQILKSHVELMIRE